MKLGKVIMGNDLRVDDAIHDLAIAYVSSRKDADKLSAEQFFDEYIKAASAIETLYYSGKSCGYSN